MQAPSKIKLHRDTAELEVQFGGYHYRLSAEFLRVHSSSAEVKGHGPEQAKLQFGKREVIINTVEPVGNYGIRLVFSDGHDSGIYTWEALQQLGENKDQLWQDYLQAIDRAGLSRDPHTSAVRLT